jgi:hypothetical protein
MVMLDLTARRVSLFSAANSFVSTAITLRPPERPARAPRLYQCNGFHGIRLLVGG